MHHLVLGSERVIWVDGLPPRHAVEPKHVCKRPISCVKRRKCYLFSQLTQYCILHIQTCWGQFTSRYLSLGSLICSKGMQVQYTHSAAHSHVAATTLAKSLSLCRRIYTWYDPYFMDGVMVHFTWQNSGLCRLTSMRSILPDDQCVNPLVRARNAPRVTARPTPSAKYVYSVPVKSRYNKHIYLTHYMNKFFFTSRPAVTCGILSAYSLWFASITDCQPVSGGLGTPTATTLAPLSLTR